MLETRVRVLAAEIERIGNLPTETRNSVAKLAGAMEGLKAQLEKLLE